MTEYQLPKTYDFKSTEPRIYEMWEKGGYFKPSNDPNKPDFDPSRKPFVISIPPPNVTGELHLGHVMFVAMEDLMIRYRRCGCREQTMPESPRSCRWRRICCAPRK
jgi:valyl-tRNA synthetase